MLDVQKFIAELHDYIGKAISPLLKKIDDLEKQVSMIELIPGEKGDPGPPGKDAQPVEIKHEDIVVALRGAPDLMRDVVIEYLKDNPPPAGKDGRDGADGKDGVDGVNGKDGRDGADGKPGEKGADGVGLSGFLVNRDGHLIGTTTDGRTHDLGLIIGKDGADLTDVQFDYDGERTITVKANGGQTVNSYTMPIVMDKGYWRTGMQCRKGDAVTHDGCLWIAQRDTEVKPGPGRKEDWRLGVRKGRDGTTVVKYKDDDPKDPVKLNDSSDKEDPDA